MLFASSEGMCFGTCAGGVLHVAVVQLPLSQEKEVVGLGPAPGVVQQVNVRTGRVLLQQPSKRACGLFTNGTLARMLNINGKASHTHTNTPQTSFLWVYFAVMPSNAHGDSPPDTLQEHRASSHATAEPSSWPPHQLSATEHARMRGRRKEGRKNLRAHGNLHPP